MPRLAPVAAYGRGGLSARDTELHRVPALSMRVCCLRLRVCSGRAGLVLGRVCCDGCGWSRMGAYVCLCSAGCFRLGAHSSFLPSPMRNGVIMGADAVQTRQAAAYRSIVLIVACAFALGVPDDRDGWELGGSQPAYSAEGTLPRLTSAELPMSCKPCLNCGGRCARVQDCAKRLLNCANCQCLVSDRRLEWCVAGKPRRTAGSRYLSRTCGESDS